MPPDTKVSLEAEIPEDLYQRVQAFLRENPTWHHDDFVIAAMCLLLMQLGDSRTRDARLYLDRVFKRSVEEAA